MASSSLMNFFNPNSIAVIGASEKLNSVGMKVFKNLIEGGYSGAIYLCTDYGVAKQLHDL